jgi:hypothetical protein
MGVTKWLPDSVTAVAIAVAQRTEENILKKKLREKVSKVTKNFLMEL